MDREICIMMQMFSQLQDESDQMLEAKNAPLADEQRGRELCKLQAVWVQSDDIIIR